MNTERRIERKKQKEGERKRDRHLFTPIYYLHREIVSQKIRRKGEREILIQVYKYLREDIQEKNTKFPISNIYRMVLVSG